MASYGFRCRELQIHVLLCGNIHLTRKLFLGQRLAYYIDDRYANTVSIISLLLAFNQNDVTSCNLSQASKY